MRLAGPRVIMEGGDGGAKAGGGRPSKWERLRRFTKTLSAMGALPQGLDVEEETGPKKARRRAMC